MGEDEVLTGRLGGHTREREGLNYLVYGGTSCLPIHYIDTFTYGTFLLYLHMVQVVCAFITLTRSSVVPTTNCTNLTYLPMAWYLSMVQTACPFITLTPSRGKKYAQLRIHYSVILLAIYTPFHNVLSKPSI